MRLLLVTGMALLSVVVPTSAGANASLREARAAIHRYEQRFPFPPIVKLWNCSQKGRRVTCQLRETQRMQLGDFEWTGHIWAVKHRHGWRILAA